MYIAPAIRTKLLYAAAGLPLGIVLAIVGAPAWLGMPFALIGIVSGAAWYGSK